MGKIRDLACSPLAWATALTMLLYAIMVVYLPSFMIVDVLDGFCIFAALMVLLVYGRAFCVSLRERRPAPADLMIAGIVLTAFGYGAIRVMRTAAVDLFGTVDFVGLRYAFGAATGLLVFGAFLHIAASGRDNGNVKPSVWWALAAAVVGGALTGLLVLALRHNWFLRTWG